MDKFVKQDVREWSPSTTGPLLPTMIDCLLAPAREVPRDVLPPFHNIVGRTERRIQRTLPFGPLFLRAKLFVGHGRGGKRF